MSGGGGDGDERRALRCVPGTTRAHAWLCTSRTPPEETVRGGAAAGFSPARSCAHAAWHSPPLLAYRRCADLHADTRRGPVDRVGDTVWRRFCSGRARLWWTLFWYLVRGGGVL